MYAFTKPADFEFPKLRLSEQQVHGVISLEKENSRAPELAIYLRTLLRAPFPKIAAGRKQVTRAFRAGPP